jgi:hypothetical protein
MSLNITHKKYVPYRKTEGGPDACSSYAHRQFFHSFVILDPDCQNKIVGVKIDDT